MRTESPSSRQPASSVRPRRKGFVHVSPTLLLTALGMTGLLAWGASPFGIGGVQGSFEQGPGALPPGTAGGSALDLSSDGRTASLRLWASPGVGTYFLDVLEFHVQARRTTTAQLGVTLSTPLGNVSGGGELLAMMGTPSASGEPGGALGPGAAVPGGSLRAIEGLGAPEAGQPGFRTGLDLGTHGVEGIGNSSGLTLSLSYGAIFVLVLTISVDLPVSDPNAFGGTALVVVITLSGGS